MGHIRDSVHVDAPIERVWELAAQCSRYPEWEVGVIGVHHCSGSIDHVGARYTAIYKFMGRRLEGPREVTKAEKPRLLEQRFISPGGAHGSFIIASEPAGGGTAVTLASDYELPGGFLGDLADKLFMGRLLKQNFKRSNESFKALCEAQG
jgi:uncharacterized membrane protein